MLSRLATTLTIATLALMGCGSDADPEPTPGPMGPPPEPFAINGSWLYLGPSDVPHTLAISPGSMVYTDVDGNWSSSWNIQTYDNTLKHFQVVFSSGSGSYRPMGQMQMSGAYEVTGTLLTVQLADGLASYPPLQGAGTCPGTDGTPAPICRLYNKQ